ncbi:MAG: HDIG domain-containing protein [Paraprevotella sp.]|nr:HDIG domain-containing protein [Paraprevotella sp.]
MDAVALIDKYYAETPRLREILWQHSRKVADRSLRIAAAHPELKLDTEFLEEAALLHDIGILRTNAPAFLCLGDAPYICHGYIGAEILRSEGYPRHARVCERHTGAGLSREEIVNQKIPIPVQDYFPETWEEQVICYADKFYSKSHLDREKTPEQALKSVSKYGEEGARRFLRWMEIFKENTEH